MSNAVLVGLAIVWVVVMVISEGGKKSLNHISCQLDDVKKTLERIADALESRSFR